MLPIFQRTVTTASGDVVPNAVAEVFIAGSDTPATIYLDGNGLTPLPNPFQTLSDGLVRFYANPGIYDIEFTATFGQIKWLAVQLIDTQDITTIGSNFSAVETTAANIAAIIDAPDQAAIATTQAGIATTQAGIATTKASEAAASAASVNANNIVHAPNSGLPNELSVAANSVYGKSNILGTVSQSSGVPTGAIIERGSNVNGEYVKYADGTMICHYENPNTITVIRGAESIFPSWTYPSSFISRPVINATVCCDNDRGDTASDTGIGFRNYNNNATTTQSPILVVRIIGSATSTPNGTYRQVISAIGRWY